jgi:hypothetical protein
MEPVEQVPQPARRLTSRRCRQWRRNISRALRTRQGRWALVALACLVVIVVGLFASGFLSSPTPAVSVPPVAGAPATTAPSSPATRSATGHASKSAVGAIGLTADPLKTLRLAFPDNPLNHLRGPGLHNVTITADSAAPIAVVGYLVPTGLGAPYGTVRPHSGHWSVTQQAVGGGYLAAVFVQTGAAGTPIVCRVNVDGRVTNSETTSGSYGRAVCLG